MLSEADPIEEEEEVEDLPENQNDYNEEEDDDDEDDDNAAETAIAINTALVASSIRNKNLNENHIGGASSRRQAATKNATNKLLAETCNRTTTSTSNATTTTSTEKQNTKDQDGNNSSSDADKQRFEYVVDRTYGVEV